MKICLDAGHGGTANSALGIKGDPGAVNSDLNLKESHCALEITKWIEELLKEAGIESKLTRTTDEFISLTNRCAISNAYKPNAFVSIHLNSAANKTAKGIETLRYSNVGNTTKTLAKNVQDALIAATGWKNRGVEERDNVTVLKKTVAPAILVEVGFISNNEEAQLLHDCRWQYKIARAIVTGIQKTFK